MAVWAIIEVFRDKDLLSRVRAELASSGFHGITSSHALEDLLSLPLLQSVYSEILRLRVEVQTVLYNDQEDIRINEWRFPKKSIIVVPAGAAHRDSQFWNTKDGEHPVDRFWADRFLVYPNDPRSGPRKTSGDNSGKHHEKTVRFSTDPGVPKFVTSGLANSYMPYGVGDRTCPGRGFARREIISFCALMVDRLDMEIMSTETSFALTPTFYGIGTQRPLNHIPFKVRKRKLEWEGDSNISRPHIGPTLPEKPPDEAA